MKYVIGIIVLLSLISLSFKQSRTKKIVYPGTIQINDTLFVDETEVTNLSWQEYTYWLKMIYGEKSTVYLAALPDTSVWLFEGMDSNEPYHTFYRYGKFFHNYPVVGINYEQAVAFCKWRTERVKYFLSVARKFDYPDFEYRLPSKEEWEYLSGGSGEIFSAQNHIEQVVNKKDNQVYVDHRKANFKSNDTLISPFYTRPVKSYSKNHLGMFDVIGNVSEMTSTKGISKGGSWNHTLDESRVGKDIIYTKPTAWLGFRCVCVVKKSISVN